MRYRSKQGLTSLLIALLPFGLIALAVIWLWKKFVGTGDNPGGISGLVTKVLGATKSGDDQKNDVNKQLITDMKTKAASKGLTPSPLHVSKSNQIYELINSINSIFTSELSEEIAQKILEIIKVNRYISDRACIIIAYGVRRPENRQHPLLGFIWDETNGTLRDHVSRYFPDGKTKVETLRYLDGAINAYM